MKGQPGSRLREEPVPAGGTGFSTLRIRSLGGKRVQKMDSRIKKFKTTT